MIRNKISLIGSGMIGGTLAHMIGIKKLGDVTLIDVNEGVAKGKALDISESTNLENLKISYIGSKDYSKIKNSDVIVVTAGFPRKNGMNRDDLLEINLKIMKEVGSAIYKYSPDAFVICVTNPLDIMVWALQKFSGLSPKKVVGMAGILDSARFRYFLSEELNISSEDISTLVLGGHGDLMVPLVRFSTISGIPLLDLIKMGLTTQEKINYIIQRTRDGGAEIISLLKNGSAYYAPSSSILHMIDAYLNDKKRILPISTYLNGEYGFSNIYVGVPIILGSNGVESIIELEFNNIEKDLFNKSVESIKKSLNTCISLISNMI